MKIYIDGVEGNYEIDALYLKTVGSPPSVTYPCSKCSQVFTTQELLNQHIASAHPVVNPPPPPPPPPIVVIPPDAIELAFGVDSVWDLGAGVTRVFSFSITEIGKNSLKINLYGRSPTTNATYKWFFPDGVEFPKYFIDKALYVPDTIVGSSSSGGFEIRAKNSTSPNVDYPSIPTGTHLLKITAIDGSSIKIWGSLKP